MTAELGATPILPTAERLSGGRRGFSLKESARRNLGC